MILRAKLLPFRIVRWRDRAAAALAILLVTAGAVHAGVRVSGDASAVRLDATGSTVAEALSALKSAFRVRVKAATALDRPIGGTYTGTLPEILSHVLRGYNYFISRHDTEIEVTVIRLQGDPAAAVRRPPPAVTGTGSQGNLAAAGGPPPAVPGGNSAFSLANAVRLKIH